jgi:hypothetical protein
MVYGATREQHMKQQSGVFTCTVCETEVLRWSDSYDFSDWLLVTKPPASAQRRHARAKAR